MQEAVSGCNSRNDCKCISVNIAPNGFGLYFLNTISSTSSDSPWDAWVRYCMGFIKLFKLFVNLLNHLINSNFFINFTGEALKPPHLIKPAPLMQYFIRLSNILFVEYR